MREIAETKQKEKEKMINTFKKKSTVRSGWAIFYIAYLRNNTEKTTVESLMINK